MFDTAECVDGEIVACNSCSHWIATAAAASAAAEDGADRAIRLLLGLAISQYRMLSIASTSLYREREDRPTDRADAIQHPSLATATATCWYSLL